MHILTDLYMHACRAGAVRSLSPGTDCGRQAIHHGMISDDVIKDATRSRYRSPKRKLTATTGAGG